MGHTQGGPRSHRFVLTTQLQFLEIPVCGLSVFAGVDQKGPCMRARVLMRVHAACVRAVPLRTDGLASTPLYLSYMLSIRIVL